ncbi:MAG: DUF3109 family protein [Bacteroidota bacterium]
MIEIGKTLVSEEIFEEHFACDLAACKGACCVLGDSGAPLLEEELDILDDIYDDVKPFLTPEGIAALEAQGTFVIDVDGDYGTPLIGGKECAYTVFDDKGIALCGIEKAWRAGAVKWKKPISCELYPIRVTKLYEHEAINYHKWNICAPACDCGAKLKLPVFRFLKEPLIRKYGKEYFEQLMVAEEYLKSKR